MCHYPPGKSWSSAQNSEGPIFETNANILNVIYLYSKYTSINV